MNQVTTEKSHQILQQISEMGLPATRGQIWAILEQENFNEERTIDRILNGLIPPV